jgi:putative peptide zinc metalloprotease protein
MVQRFTRSTATKALRWSAGRPSRRALLALATAGIVALLAWAWWPSGQYQPVRASDHGTLSAAPRLVSAQVSPPPVAQAQAAPITLAPGRHLAVALIPSGGATPQHPAIVVIKGGKGVKPAVLVTAKMPPTGKAPALKPGAAAGPATAAPQTPPAASPPVPATAFPFKLPAKPGPNDSQALATNSTDGGITYDVVYSLVTVQNGDPVDEENSAYALASCRACTTVAVSFQLVLVVGRTATITPINVAEALNYNCPSCVTTAIADQIVVTLSAAPSDELVRRLTAELQQLHAIDQLGAGGTPGAVAEQVAAVQHQIEQELQASGLVVVPTPTSSPAATATPQASPQQSPAATPSSTPTPSPTTTPSPSATTSPTDTPTASPTPTPTPTPTATP